MADTGDKTKKEERLEGMKKGRGNNKEKGKGKQKKKETDEGHKDR